MSVAVVRPEILRANRVSPDDAKKIASASGAEIAQTKHSSYIKFVGGATLGFSHFEAADKGSYSVGHMYFDTAIDKETTSITNRVLIVRGESVTLVNVEERQEEPIVEKINFTKRGAKVGLGFLSDSTSVIAEAAMMVTPPRYKPL